MRRRDFVGGLGVAAAWPFVARGQQPERMRRVGVLIFSAEDDPVTATRSGALRDGLQKLGWTEGVNLQIDYRFGAADPARLHSHAEELVRLSPDVIVAGAAPATRAVQQLTQTIPIVFVEATNEVGFGLTGNLARSAANATGITNLYLAMQGRKGILMKRPMAKKTKKSRPWSKEDIRMLKTMVREKTKTSVVARKLKRTPTATRQKAAALGVKLAGASQRKKRA